MLKLEGLIFPHGPQVPVSFCRPSAQMELHFDDKPPREVSALLDTGASHTHLDVSIPEYLSLNPTGLTPVGTTLKDGYLPNYAVDIVFQDGKRQRRFKNIQVSASEVNRHGIAAIIGRDILRHCNLLLNGPEDAFTLSFS